MFLASTSPNYANRDEKGKVAFYVLLWKRASISLGLFDNYWKDVHGPVCARLPGQYQYWQFHVAHDEGGFFPEIPDLDYKGSPEDNFDGIAELTFETEADRNTWFKASAILMDDEHNLFKKAIGYNTSPGNSITYYSGLANGAPNGEIGVVRFHVLIQKIDRVSVEEFRQYLKDTFAPKVSQSDLVHEFRLHLFDEVDNSRPDAAGVIHYEPINKQYHAACRITFANHLERERFFSSPEYNNAIQEAAKYIKQVRAFPERSAYTFVDEGKMTLAGQRSAKVADLISRIGAANQLKEDITSLMLLGNTYNTASGANYSGPNKSNNLAGLSASYSTAINASLQSVWETLLDKMENPGKYMPAPVEYVKVLEKYPDGVLRELKTPGELVRERVTIDEKVNKITYEIVNYPNFKPTFINQVTLAENGVLPLLTNIFLLKPLTDNALEEKEAEHFVKAAEPKFIEMATLHIKKVIEQKNQQQEDPMIQTVTSAGPKSEIVRQMFIAGESMNVENFVKFYTEDAHYQFSNFPVAYGPQGIIDSSQGFLQTVAKVHHHITKMWEEGDTVICEMEVTYVRYDGKVFRLPCCDTVVFKGDKVQELRIYMDISPVFETAAIEVQKPAVTSGGLTTKLGKMYEALHASNWEEFKTFFTPDVLYKIGANDPVIGPDAIAGLLQHIYKTLKLTTHNTRGMWEIGNTIILEMDANYIHRTEKRFVQVPCTDIYRYDGDKIYEWRVYPDASRTNIQL